MDIFRKIDFQLEKSKISKIIFFVIILNVIFLFLHIIFLKDFLLNIINANPDYINKRFYKLIFSNLEKSIIIFTISAVLLCVFFSYIKNFILKFNENNILGFCLLSVLILQLLILIFVKTIPISDSIFYLSLAERLYETDSYIKPNGFHTSFWPIGYPFYLYLLRLISNDNVLIARVMNILLSLFHIFIIYQLFKDSFDKKQRIFFILILSFYPNFLLNSNVLLTENIFCTLLWFILFVVYKKKLSFKIGILIGILIGVLSYFKPIGFIVIIALLFYYLMNFNFKYYFPRFLIILLFFILTLLPWIYRNYVVYNDLVLVSTNGGFIFLMGNHVNSSGGVNFNFSYDADNKKENLIDREAYFRTFEHIKRKPLKAIFRIPKKLFYSYYRGDTYNTWAFKLTENTIQPYVISFIFYSTNFSYYLLMLFSLVSIINIKSLKISKRMLSLIIPVYILFLLVILIFVGNERYIIPLYPIHFFLVTKYLIK